MNISSPKYWFKFFCLILIALFSCQNASRPNPWIIQAPAGNQYAVINESGSSIIPNGRKLTPSGKTIRIAPHPYGLTLSPDGNVAITANSGNRPFSLSVITDVLSGDPVVQQIPEGVSNDEDLLGAVFMGLAVTPDNSSVYAAGGQENKIYQFDLKTGAKIREIDCSSQNAERSRPCCGAAWPAHV